MKYAKGWREPDEERKDYICSLANHESPGAPAVALKIDSPYVGACKECHSKLVKRTYRNSPRKTARERAVYVINRGAMAEDIEKQIQLAVNAYAKRKANRK